MKAISSILLLMLAVGVLQAADTKAADADKRAASNASSDAIIRVMRDELERSRQLGIAGQQPYYMEYALDDADSFSASASLGGLVGSNHSRFRLPQVRIRVGDYRFDNTNYVLSDYFSGSRYDPDRF